MSCRSKKVEKFQKTKFSAGSKMHFFALPCTSLHFFALLCTTIWKCKSKMHFLSHFWKCIHIIIFMHFQWFWKCIKLPQIMHFQISKTLNINSTCSYLVVEVHKIGSKMHFQPEAYLVLEVQKIWV